MNGDRRARWAISFADLALLLLGFFVLLQASGSRGKAMLQGVSQQFGGKALAATPDAVEWRASDMFAPGEAMLTPAGKARIEGYARRFVQPGVIVELTSMGQDRGARRFDAWDLAAARLGAVARAMEAAGVGDRNMLIRGLDQAAGQQAQTGGVMPNRASEQIIRLNLVAAKSG
jgi:flagellar motor protein MotB